MKAELLHLVVLGRYLVEPLVVSMFGVYGSYILLFVYLVFICFFLKKSGHFFFS